jgi:hypothetical protein
MDHILFRRGVYSPWNSEITSILTLSLQVNFAFLKEFLDIFLKFILLLVIIKMLTSDVFYDHIVSDIYFLGAKTVFGYRGLLLMGNSKRLAVISFGR